MNRRRRASAAAAGRGKGAGRPAAVRAFAVLAALATAACQAPLPEDFAAAAPGGTWEARGRLIMDDGQRKQALTFNWLQRGAAYVLQFSDPLGRLLFRVRSAAPGSVTFTERDGATHSAENEEELLRRLLGRSFPVQHLRHWIRGRPAPDVPAEERTLAADDSLLRLRQAGWSLQFDRRQSEGEWRLPTAVQAQSGNLRLRLRIWDWKTPESAD